MVVASICEDKDVKKWIYIPEVGKKLTWKGMGKVKRNVEEMERCREIAPR